MSYVSTVLADTPDAFWMFGESTGSAEADSSGNGHTLTLAGTYALGQTGLIPSVAGTAIGFTAGDGTPSPALPDPAGDFALETWLELPAPPGSAQTCLALYNSTLNLEVSGVVHVILFGGTNYYGTLGVCDGLPHHVVFTRSSGVLYLYVDGALDTNFGAFAGTVYFSASAFVGAFNATPANPFTGKLQAMALYAAHGLTSSQVAAHHAAGTAVATRKVPVNLFQQGVI